MKELPKKKSFNFSIAKNKFYCFKRHFFHEVPFSFDKNTYIIYNIGVKSDGQFVTILS